MQQSTRGIGQYVALDRIEIGAGVFADGVRLPDRPRRVITDISSDIEILTVAKIDPGCITRVAPICV